MKYYKIMLCQTYENQDDPLDSYCCSLECVEVYKKDIKENYPNDEISYVEPIENEEEFELLCDNCGKKI